MISVGSRWRHAEGLSAEIDAVGDDWVEPRNSGRWPIAKFERDWVQLFTPPPTPPEMQWDFVDRDGTDGAHPAWWRGFRAGEIALAAQLLPLIVQGGMPHHDNVIVSNLIEQIGALHTEIRRLSDGCAFLRGQLRTQRRTR